MVILDPYGMTFDAVSVFVWHFTFASNPAQHTVPSLNRTHVLSFFSGGIFCDSAGVTCGGTAIGVSGVIYREGHTYVLNHGVTADNAAGSLGFKLSYIQLPCSASGTSYTTV